MKAASAPGLLTPAQRQSLPVVQWQAYTAPRYGHLRSTNTLGTWYIGHPRQTGSGPDAVDLAYQLPMDPGETIQSLMEEQDRLPSESPRAQRQWAKISKQDIGYVYNQDYAVLFVEKALRQEPGASPEEILLRAGFQVETHGHGRSPLLFFRKEDAKRGVFTLFMDKHSLTLTHQKRTANHWDNLLSVHTQFKGASGKTCHRAVSPHVDNIVAAAAEMAVYFVENWKPVPARPRPKSPSP